MPRVTPITSKEQVASEHQPIFDAVAEGRGSVRGPFSIMMHSPEMGQVLQLLDNETGMHSCLATKPSVAGWHRRQEEASPWSREYRHPNGQARSSVSC